MSQPRGRESAVVAVPSDEARDEDARQYSTPGSTVDEEYPQRPRNHGKTLPFSDLYLTLFTPLNENKKGGSAGAPATRTRGAGGAKLSAHEQRRHIIERFIARWRTQVGADLYPALRLILPDKDRDRGLYGLRESNIGKILVRVLKLDRNSEDAHNLLHWKLPGQTLASRMAGDFAGRCLEVLAKRQLRTAPGDLSVADVNVLLDQLAAAAGEAESLAVFQTLYQRMNADELMWLIRIVLKQLKVGATEKTFLDIWHPDAEALFSVSSSLRKVCWELGDRSVRLEQDEVGMSLMQCFQPQLAQFQMPKTFEQLIQYLGVTEQDPEFWIEEKLDGERMQMHMVEDADTPGGTRFCFWSRKGKDYTYLYGSSYEDERSSLTRHLKGAFASGVRNIILDGEMVTWSTIDQKVMPFGTLKTAALSEQRSIGGGGGGGGGQGTADGKDVGRPVFRVFDVLYLNDKQLTQYTLRDRRRALQQAVKGVAERLEVHEYKATSSCSDIDTALRDVVAQSFEGLVLKNPRSMYRLNSRNDDWVKVKPEYMSEFGESLDCVIIGGYYGSGRRGGALSSFLCGLRVGPNQIRSGVNPEKFYSFFKVGGGFRAEDYAEIRHHLDGKWVEWDAKRPPTEYIELAGGDRQHERPDVWIRPSQSIVIEAKAASVGSTDQFALGLTLRFPRFRRLRLDKAWDAALNIDEFRVLRAEVDKSKHEQEMSIEQRKRQNRHKRVKRERVIVGVGSDDPEYHASETRTSRALQGLGFCVLTDAGKPFRKTKAQLEALIKEHGGLVSQRAEAGPSSSTSSSSSSSDLVLLGEKKVVKVASLIKNGNVDIVKPKWLMDCLAQPGGGFVLPYEPGHLFHATPATRAAADDATDKFGDSYARATDVAELRALLADMPKLERDDDDDDEGLSSAELLLHELAAHGHELAGVRGLLFKRCAVHFAYAPDQGADMQRVRAANVVRFAGGRMVAELAEDAGITHVAVFGGRDMGRAEELGRRVLREVGGWRGGGMPRVVVGSWVETCWMEGTLVDEEAFAV